MPLPPAKPPTLYVKSLLTPPSAFTRSKLDILKARSKYHEGLKYATKPRSCRVQRQPHQILLVLLPLMLFLLELCKRKTLKRLCDYLDVSQQYTELSIPRLVLLILRLVFV